MKYKLKVISKPTLTLIKEKTIKYYGDVFEVDEDRGEELLKTKFKNKPVVELVEKIFEKSNQRNVRKERKGEMKYEQRNERD